MIQFNLSPSVAQPSSAFHHLSCVPATADIVIEVIEVDEISKGYHRYVAFVELIHLNDLLNDTASLLSTNLGVFILSRSASWSAGRKLPCTEVVHTT